MLNTVKILMKESLDLELVIVLGYRNTKAFLLKDIPKIDLKKFLFLVKLRIQFCGHTRLVIPIVIQLLEVFMKKNCKN